MTFERLSRWNQETLTLLRIVSGVLFWAHGAQKLFGLFGGRQMALGSLMGVAGILEFFGGIAIALGFFTRPVALLLSGEMACAYFLSHFPRGFWPIRNGGELAVLFCFIYLFLATAGGGKLQLSNLFGKRS